MPTDHTSVAAERAPSKASGAMKAGVPPTPLVSLSDVKNRDMPQSASCPAAGATGVPWADSSVRRGLVGIRCHGETHACQVRGRFPRKIPVSDRLTVHDQHPTPV